LAERLTARGTPAVVAFETLKNMGGQADVSAAVAQVSLDESLVAWPAEWAGIETASTLAHELLGHVLFGRLAQDAGVGWEYNSTLDDEVNAEVVGSLVELEAGWSFSDPHASLLLSDRAGFESELLWREPAYAATLRGQELADPVSALSGRSAEAGRRGLPDFVADIASRLAVLQARADLRDDLARYPSSAFYASFEAELAARIARLRTLEPAAPGPLAMADESVRPL
ncbi:MAG: hypothetical protein KGL53_01640, partial [Elusimicrobia bacterium]|nr:hypothetical protein [Elusimicrobiota bacterium]